MATGRLAVLPSQGWILTLCRSSIRVPPHSIAALAYPNDEGGGSLAPLEGFATVLTHAMSDTDVRRAVIISTAFLFKDSLIPPTYLIGKLLFPTVVTDSAALEGIIQKSDLDWTIVRPPQLTDTPFTGNYRVRLGHLPRMGFKIGRPDVAEFFLQATSDNTLIRKDPKELFKISLAVEG